MAEHTPGAPARRKRPKPFSRVNRLAYREEKRGTTLTEIAITEVIRNGDVRRGVMAHAVMWLNGDLEPLATASGGMEFLDDDGLSLGFGMAATRRARNVTVRKGGARNRIKRIHKDRDAQATDINECLLLTRDDYGDEFDENGDPVEPRVKIFMSDATWVTVPYTGPIEDKTPDAGTPDVGEAA